MAAQTRKRSEETRGHSAQNDTQQALPAHAMAQGSDVRDVVLAVPGIRRERIVQSHGAALGMLKPSRKILRVHAAQKHDPSSMQRFEQSERHLDGRFLRVI
jgi:hypothetical protein